MSESSRKTLRILIAGGGTGGHLFPGMAIAEAYLKDRPCDIRFVGTTRGLEASVVPASGLYLYTIPVSGLYRVGFRKKLKTLIRLPLAILQSFWILITFRPHLVIGIGGYASGPMLALAFLLGKKTVIQEQNAYPGLTNRILGKRVPLAFVPFSGLDRLFRNPVVSGNPIRQSILTASKSRDPRPDNQFVISVIGGSQGAQILNRTMIQILPDLANLPGSIHVNHQTGQRDLQTVTDAYALQDNLSSTVQAFFNEMENTYLQSRLIICRAGSIVNEIIAVGRASILVPIAVSSGNHQLENARKMAAAGAAILIEEKDLTPDKLLDEISRLLSTPEQIREMEHRAKALFSGDAATMIVNETNRFYGF